jgi:hypothetical protein
MTRDEILNMKAGDDMNALVATEIFKMEESHEPSWWWLDGMMEELPDYSTDIGAAWKVVEEVAGPESLFSATVVGQYAGGQWRCLFSNAFDAFDVTAETAPLAICRAALLAITKEK